MNGKVTAVSPGEATITVKADGGKDSNLHSNSKCSNSSGNRSNP